MTFSQFSRVFTWLSSQNAVLGQHIYLVNNNEMFVHIKKELRLYLDYHIITCAYVLYLLFTIKPQKIVSLYTTTTILAFSSERNRPFIRKERATHISSERIRFGYATHTCALMHINSAYQTIFQFIYHTCI